MADAWDWWREALLAVNSKPKQRVPAFAQGECRQGYFRLGDDPVAIWQQGTTWWAQRGTQKFSGEKVPALFDRVAKTPVTHAAWDARVKTGTWPTDLPTEARGIGDNSGADPLEVKREEIENAWTAFDNWLKGIGGEITTQEQADLAGNYAERFTKLERGSDKEREDEKRPHLEAGREVDSKWKPVIQRAFAGKEATKKALGVFLRAEKARREKLAYEAEQQRLREIAASPLAEPSAPAEPAIVAAPVHAGTGSRRVGLTTVKCVRITDIEQVKATFIRTPAGEQAAREWAMRVGANSAVPIPGTEQFTDEVAR